MGLGPYRAQRFTENRFRQAFGMPLRTRYDVADPIELRVEPLDPSP